MSLHGTSGEKLCIIDDFLFDSGDPRLYEGLERRRGTTPGIPPQDREKFLMYKYVLGVAFSITDVVGSTSVYRKTHEHVSKALLESLHLTFHPLERDLLKQCEDATSVVLRDINLFVSLLYMRLYGSEAYRGEILERLDSSISWPTAIELNSFYKAIEATVIKSKGRALKNKASRINKSPHFDLHDTLDFSFQSLG